MKKMVNNRFCMAVQRSVLIEDFRAAIEKSPYTADCTDKNTLLVFNAAGEKVAEAVPFLRSVTLSIHTNAGIVTIELYRSEFNVIVDLLLKVDASVTANVFLALYNDWSESIVYDKRHDCIRVCGYHVRAVNQNNTIVCYLNLEDQCYALPGVDCLAVNLATREFSIEPCLSAFAV